ncbi:MAG TPA: hypothetical protein VK856_12945 [Anaerolineaceae bacterium]|nr:hypothetical protein [Anaerolineaceae bacterium]
MKKVNVFLIGGAPGVGKTTLGCALASKLNIASGLHMNILPQPGDASVDDLCIMILETIDG